tara:strand:- start:14709 stop:15020 length:312 start_codon:yes stop_codon:yes gene_type:complete
MAHSSISKDKVVLDLTYDDDLRNYMASKEVGERCSLELKLSVDEVTNDQAVLSVDGVVANQYDVEKKMSPEGPADMERPAAAIMLAVRDSMTRTQGPKGKEKY